MSVMVLDNDELIRACQQIQETSHLEIPAGIKIVQIIEKNLGKMIKNHISFHKDMTLIDARIDVIFHLFERYRTVNLAEYVIKYSHHGEKFESPEEVDFEKKFKKKNNYYQTYSTLGAMLYNIGEQVNLPGGYQECLEELYEYYKSLNPSPNN